jgi:hypothetical protein
MCMLAPACQEQRVWGRAWRMRALGARTASASRNRFSLEQVVGPIVHTIFVLRNMDESTATLRPGAHGALTAARPHTQACRARLPEQPDAARSSDMSGGRGRERARRRLPKGLRTGRGALFCQGQLRLALVQHDAPAVARQRVCGQARPALCALGRAPRPAPPRREAVRALSWRRCTCTCTSFLSIAAWEVTGPRRVTKTFAQPDRSATVQPQSIMLAQARSLSSVTGSSLLVSLTANQRRYN